MIRVRQPDFCRVGRPDIREMVQLIWVDPDDPGALPDDPAGQIARLLLVETNFWAEFGDFGIKIGEISWMEGGETWGNARST